MRYEVSSRIRTIKPKEALLDTLYLQFSKVADKVVRGPEHISARAIEATFGSINRTDDTVITLKPADGGYLVVADVHYRPSVAFWIILIITLFTWIGWILPIAFYLIQKSSVRKTIETCLERVKNEFDGATGSTPAPVVTTQADLANLESLARLKEQGIISESEFALKKKQILGL